MLQAISWNRFFELLIISSLLYYAVLALIYYRYLISLQQLSKIRLWIGQKRYKTIIEGDEETLFEVASNLSKVLRISIRRGNRNDLIKEELLFSVKTILQDYRQIIGTPFQHAINNEIEKCCEEECSIYLSAEELRGLWMG